MPATREVNIDGRTYLVGSEAEVLDLEGRSLDSWNNDDNLDVVGKVTPRIDGEDIVTGKTTFTFDIQRPDMLHAKILRSPYAHARIVKIDTEAAARHPGVKCVLTHRSPENITWGKEKRGLLPQEVKFAGEEVAAVVAIDEFAAEDALALINVEYEVLPAVVEIEEAIKAGYPVGRGQPESYERGDLATGLSEADITYEQTYRTPFQHHACIEMHGCVAEWQEGVLTVWDSGQGVHLMKEQFAQSLNVPEKNVRVICGHTGGGFGSKLRLKAYHLIAAILSKQAGKPVRLFMTREEEFIATPHRPRSIQWFKAGVKKDGTLTALEHKVSGQHGPYEGLNHPGTRSGEQTRELYRCQNVRTDADEVYTHTSMPGSFRAPGGLENTYSFEQFVDELAEKVGMDPIEFRMKNYASVDQVHNQPYTCKSLMRCYQEGARAIGWARRKDPAYRQDKQGLKRGIGMSSVWWHTKLGDRSEGIVNISTDGTIELRAGISDFGNGAPTIFCQIVAEELGVPLDRVRIKYGDSSTTPYSIDGSRGSKTTFMFGPVIRAAAAHAKWQLFKLVAERLEANEDDLETRLGRIFVRGNPNHYIDFSDAAALIGTEPIVGFSERRSNTSGFTCSIFGAYFTEVEVDSNTGIVHVIKAVCAQDSGRWLNPLLMESQIQGGFLQGMSLTLMEERAMDREDGVQHNANLGDYRVLTSKDIPDELITIRVEDRDIINSINAKGVGEVGLLGAGAAIANAIYDAVRVRVRDYPITPDKILRAMGKVVVARTVSLGGFST